MSKKGSVAAEVPPASPVAFKGGGPVATELRELAKKWKRDTAALSSVSQMAMHPSYQRIIGHGPDALPFLLGELSKEPDHWFWALQAITGENPIPVEDQGRLPKMAEAWVSWGQQRGYC